MTFSNGGWNPNPLANPLNTRLGPSNYSLNPKNPAYSRTVFNSSCKQLPEPIPYGQDSQALQLPDTTPMMSFQSLQNIIDDYARDKTWDDRQLYLDILNGVTRSSQGLSRKDIEYWQNAERKSAELCANMSDEQKEMLEQLKKLGIFDTKLEEVPDNDLPN